ncbi:MAG: nuclear transport factor 2 family protein [Bacteroidia bacterium]
MKNLFLIVLLLCNLFTKAQTPNDDIKKVIQTLFVAMQQGDSTLANSCFDGSAHLQTALFDKKTNKTKLINEPLDSFLFQVNSIKKLTVKIEERITNYDIKIDDPLASVWAEYEFYIDGKLSHKGVDAFQLFKSNAGWKIIQICDTRRK